LASFILYLAIHSIKAGSLLIIGGLILILAWAPIYGVIFYNWAQHGLYIELLIFLWILTAYTTQSFSDKNNRIQFFELKFAMATFKALFLLICAGICLFDIPPLGMAKIVVRYINVMDGEKQGPATNPQALLLALTIYYALVRKLERKLESKYKIYLKCINKNNSSAHLKTEIKNIHLDYLNILKKKKEKLRANTSLKNLQQIKNITKNLIKKVRNPSRLLRRKNKHS